MRFRIALCTILSLMLSKTLHAQSSFNSEKAIWSKVANKHYSNYDYLTDNAEMVSQGQDAGIVGGLFLFYKKFVSSQDSQNCSFHPSCSEYMLLSTQQMGKLKGLLNGLDRMARCHGLSPAQYEIDYTSGLLLDPIN
jgi:uncharacterized protein